MIIKIKQAMKTLFTRIGDIKIGDYLEDGVGEADVLKVLRSVGVELKKDDQTYRDFSDILTDLAKNWQNLTDVQQKAVSKTVAGTRQANVFMTLVENMSRALQLAEVSADSAGLAQERYGVYLESTEAKLNKFKTTMQELYTKTISSDFINMLIDAGTAVVNFVNSLGGLPPILMTIGTILVSKNIEKLFTMLMGSSLVSGINNIVKFTTNLGLAWKLASTEATTLASKISLTTGLMKTQYGQAIATKSAMSLLGAGIGAVGLALSVGIGLYSRYKQKQEEIRQSALDSAQALNDSKKEIEDYAQKYQELHEQLIQAKGDEEATLDVKKQLYELQNELNDKYGEEARQIDITTNMYKDQTQAIRDLNKAKAEQWQNENQKAVTKATNEMNKEKDYTVFSLANPLRTNDTYGYNEFLDGLAKKYGLKQVDGQFGWKLVLTANAKDAEKTINDFMTELRQHENDFDDNGYFSKLFDVPSNALNDAKKTVEKYNDIYEQSLMTQIAVDDKLSEKYGEVTDAVEKYNEAVMEGNPENIKVASEKLEELRQTLSGDEYSRFSVIFEKIFETAQKYNSLKLENPSFVGIENNNDLTSLESMKAQLEKRILLETDNTKIEETKEILAEINTQIEYVKQNPVDVKVNDSDLDKLSDALSEIDLESLSKDSKKIVEEIQEAISTGSKVSAESLEKLVEIFPNLRLIVQQAKDELLDFESALESIQGEVDDYANNMKTLNDTIEKVRKGETLSGDTIVKLKRQYPELSDSIIETNGVYGIELDTLEELRNSLEESTKKQLEGELEKTKVVIQQSQQRIKMYLQEKKEYAMLSQLSFNEDGTMNIGQAMQNNMRSEDSPLKLMIDDYNKQLETYKAIEEEINNLSIVGQEGENGKSKKNYPKYIEQGLDDIVEILQSKRDVIQKEIDKLSKQLSFEELTHGKYTERARQLREQIDELNRQIKEGLHDANEELRPIKEDYFKQIQQLGLNGDLGSADELTNVEIEKQLRALEKQKSDLEVNNNNNVNDEVIAKTDVLIDKYKELADAIITINEAMETNSSDWFDVQNELTQSYIDSVNDKVLKVEFDVDTSKLDNTLSDLTIDPEDSDYYERTTEMLQRSLDEQYTLQKAYLEAYNEFAEKGYSEQANEYKKKMVDSAKEVYDLKKKQIENEIALQQSLFDKQSAWQDKVVGYLKDQDNLQKDKLQKEKDAIEEEADARKKSLEGRKDELDLIKKEHDNQKKINDLRKNLANTLSDLNALEFDDSASAIQDKIELMNKADEQKDALNEELLNQAIEGAKDAIERQIQAIEDDKNSRTEAIDKAIQALNDKTDRDYQTEANRLIKNDEASGELYQKMLQYYSENGTGTTTELKQAWLDVKDILASINFEDFQQVLQGLNDSIMMSNINKSGLSVLDAEGNEYGGVRDVQTQLLDTQNNISSILPIINQNQDMLKTLQVEPKTITNTPVLQLNIAGNTYDGVENRIANWFASTGSRLMQGLLEGSIMPNVTNSVKRTK